MKKIVKLKICNWSLLPLSIAIMISGIQLEATQSSDTTSVWIHIAVGILFSAMVLYHIFLHLSNSDWFSKFNRQKSRLTRILWPVSLITFISGIVAGIHWLGTFTHAAIGGIHGKFGFIMLILSTAHICTRIKFFRSKKAAPLQSAAAR